MQSESSGGGPSTDDMKKKPSLNKGGTVPSVKGRISSGSTTSGHHNRVKASTNKQLKSKNIKIQIHDSVTQLSSVMNSQIQLTDITPDVML
jgi:hypothetical protein